MKKLLMLPHYQKNVIAKQKVACERNTRVSAYNICAWNKHLHFESVVSNFKVKLPFFVSVSQSAKPVSLFSLSNQQSSR